MHLSRAATTLAAAALMTTLITGCGDDADSPSASEPAAVQEDTASSAPSGTPSDAPSEPPAPEDAGDVTAFCAAYEVLSEIDPAAKDPKELEVNVIAFAAATIDAAKAAPPKLQEPAQLLADRFPEYVAMVEAADYRPTKKQVIAFFADPEIAKAANKLDVFAEDNCDS